MPARSRAAVPPLLAAALLAAPLAPPAGAAEAQFQIVTSRNQYFPAEVTIVEGSTLMLTNADLERHDVRALDTDGGQPLFRSAIIGPGQQAEVVGVSALTESIYPFFCTVHEWMTGNITVLALP